MRSIWWLGILGTLVCGCSSPGDEPGGSGGLGGSGGTGGSSGTGAAGGMAATGGTMAGGATGGTSGSSGSTSMAVQCNELEAAGPLTEWTTAPGTPPEPLGGTLVDGTYYLTRVTMYGQSGLLQATGGRTTIEVAGSVWNGVEDPDAPETPSPSSVNWFTIDWTASGTMLSLTQTCPDSATTEAQYSVDDAGNLTLYVLDHGVMFGERYERK